MSKKSSSSHTDSENMHLLSPGQILCRGRKEKGLSAEEVMMHLGITHRTFEALEKDEYDRLPSPLYVKGYIRRYCSILGMSDTEVVAAFDSKINELGLVNKDPVLRVEHRPRVSGSNSGRKAVVNVIVIVVIAITLAFFIWSYISDTRDKDISTEVEEQPLSKSLVGDNELVVENQPVAEDLPIETIDATEKATEKTTELSVENIIDVTPENSSELNRENDDVQPMARPVIAPNAHVLQITVTQQSWIEIVDAKGDILLADLKTSGYQGEVKGMAPFDVILGYAPGVKLILNGRKVEIPLTGNNNTAKLKIGDKEEG